MLLWGGKAAVLPRGLMERNLLHLRVQHTSKGGKGWDGTPGRIFPSASPEVHSRALGPVYSATLRMLCGLWLRLVETVPPTQTLAPSILSRERFLGPALSFPSPPAFWKHPAKTGGMVQLHVTERVLRANAIVLRWLYPFWLLFYFFVDQNVIFQPSSFHAMSSPWMCPKRFQHS